MYYKYSFCDAYNVHQEGGNYCHNDSDMGEENFDEIDEDFFLLYFDQHLFTLSPEGFLCQKRDKGTSLSGIG